MQWPLVRNQIALGGRVRHGQRHGIGSTGFIPVHTLISEAGEIGERKAVRRCAPVPLPRRGCAFRPIVIVDSGGR